MKKIILISCLFFILACTLSAQEQPDNKKKSQNQLDSLHNALAQSNNDTLRLSILLDLTVYYWEVNLDSSLYYTDESMSLAKKLNYRLDEGRLLGTKADLYSRKGLYAKSLELNLESLNILNDRELSGGISSFWRTLFENENPREIQLLSSADVTRTFSALFASVGNYQKALSMSLQAKAVMERFHYKMGLFFINLNNTSFYFKLGKSDSAMISLRECAKIDANRKYKYWDGLPNQIFGRIYLRTKEYGKSISFLQDAIQIHSENNNLRGLSQAQNALAQVYLATGNPVAALQYVAKAIPNASSAGYSDEQIMEGYTIISKAYHFMNKQDSAYFYLSLATALKDSLQQIKEENISKFNIALLDENLRNRDLEKERIATQNRQPTYAFIAALGLFSILALLLYRNNRQKQKWNRQLAKQKEDLENTLDTLKATQAQLIQSEKMASLGELTAGIAHEIQNPLNFVNNFSEVNRELIAEMKEEIDKGNYDEVKLLANDVEENEGKINHHGKRADAIVKGMLQHSRASTGKKEPTDINALADEYLRLSYHGLKAKDKSFNATMQTDFDTTISKINIVPEDIGRVLLNLYNNAFYAISEKSKQQGEGFEPAVSVTTKKVNDKVEISVKDNGNGIPQKVVDKIFQPFFTTKPTGQGTGLGLSLSYDIVKAHGGEIKVESKDGEGSEFIIQIPV